MRWNPTSTLSSLTFISAKNEVSQVWVWSSPFREPTQLVQIGNWLKHCKVFCFFFSFRIYKCNTRTVRPPLLPRWHLGNRDLHVNRTRKSTFWVSRGSRCEDRCRAPWILTGVRGCEKLWTEAKPKPNKPAGFQFFCVTWRSAPTKIFANMLSPASALEQGKKVGWW